MRMLTSLQDWLYDEGEDASKAVYIAKMDEIRSTAGPIVQRYFDKLEEEREAERAKIDAENEYRRKMNEQAASRKKKEEKKNAKNAGTETPADVESPAAKDEEMTEAPQEGLDLD